MREIIYPSDFRRALRSNIRAFEYAKILEQITKLSVNPGHPENGRRRLKTIVSWCPEAEWRLRLGTEIRILYRFDSKNVFIECAALKRNEELENADVIYPTR